jgi:hypothetical protein
MISSFVAFVPGGFWMFLVSVAIIAGVLVFYALYSKVYVKAVFAHGTTVFQLEAQGPQQNDSLKANDPSARSQK